MEVHQGKEQLKVTGHVGTEGGSWECLDDDKGYSLNGGFRLPSAIFNRLYDYQRDGVQWMWGLHQRETGGILGDDMGLGKTFQVTCFATGLMAAGKKRSGRIRYGGRRPAVLMVVPVSLINTWEEEMTLRLATVLKQPRIVVIRNFSSNLRKQELKEVQQRGGCVVSSYGLIANHVDKFAGEERDFRWAFIAADEGHVLKNSATKAAKVRDLLFSK